jgi:predicted helicase
MRALDFDEVSPDKNANWVNLTNNDFETLLPLALKSSKSSSTSKSVFSLYSQGVKSNRDEWVWGSSEKEVMSKVGYLIDTYNASTKSVPNDATVENVGALVETEIKWTRKLKRLLLARTTLRCEPARLVRALYRPFTAQFLYFDINLNEDTYRLFSIFGPGHANQAFVFTDTSPRTDFSALACDEPFEHHIAASTDSFQCVSLYRFDEAGNRTDNITDWALKQFTAHYADEIGKGKAAHKITKPAIFHYCYAVLHDPLYREKYAQNLKREFPRIPFYADFWRWADWGEQLMALHIGFDSAPPFALTRTDEPDTRARAAGQQPKALLRSDPAVGSITLDSETTLRGVPTQAWAYKLGNRSAIDWVLDQHKEKKPKDPTIREKFDTYRFADHKEKLLDLLARLTTVSVETVRITEAMKGVAR